MRLSNVKTRDEMGFDYVVHSLNLITPFGMKVLKELTPYMIGGEDLLRVELRKTDTLLKFVELCPKETELLLQIFMNVKECTFSLERCDSSILSVVELFEVKSLLLAMQDMSKLLEDVRQRIPKDLMLSDTKKALDMLDPRGDRINTFYIYDEFSEQIGELRKEKRKRELSIRSLQKDAKREIEEKYGIALTPKFDYKVSKSNTKLAETVESLPEMMMADQDYMSVTFVLKPTEQVMVLVKEMDHFEALIVEEELQIREELSLGIAQYKREILDNCRIIGDFDFTLSKAIYARVHNCVMPEIGEDHILEIHEGRHLRVEDILMKKGEKYCPVSISLRDGVTCITGANMGGKTVSLKLVGLIALLAQYGFFVPCKSAKIGLSSYIRILIGDSQSIERGLSSFGSEMEELKEMLDQSVDSSLLLIDEIASGTNPIEGLALTKSLVKYLKHKKNIALITTHFDSLTEDSSVKNMQVAGLAGVDFVMLEREIKYANRRERIGIIAKYMDYRLEEVRNKTEIPKDALNIAKMLGVNNEIIENAQKLLKSEKEENRRQK